MALVQTLTTRMQPPLDMALNQLLDAYGEANVDLDGLEVRLREQKAFWIEDLETFWPAMGSTFRERLFQREAESADDGDAARLRIVDASRLAFWIQIFGETAESLELRRHLADSINRHAMQDSSRWSFPTETNEPRAELVNVAGLLSTASSHLQHAANEDPIIAQPSLTQLKSSEIDLLKILVRAGHAMTHEEIADAFSLRVPARRSRSLSWVNKRVPKLVEDKILCRPKGGRSGVTICQSIASKIPVD